ncbi:hypothetical protein VRK_14890 [Vibrio sp. MEBiC08052]|nr:hypothetical protein VRK_14890 [Vibrio sp. MEBiC08052]
MIFVSFFIIWGSSAKILSVTFFSRDNYKENDDINTFLL